MNTLATQSDELLSSDKEKKTEETKIKKEKKENVKKEKKKKKVIIKNEKEIKEKEKGEIYDAIINKEENINELPYSKAINEDKRNIIHIYFSFLKEKLELINIILVMIKSK